MFTITRKENGPGLVLAMEGKLDGRTAELLEAQIQKLVEEKPKLLDIDCLGLTYVSSAGLRAFLSAAKKLHRAGVLCSWTRLSPPVQEVFRISGFLSLLKIQEALPPGDPESAAPTHDLTLVEEFILLMLDDQTGAQLKLPYGALGYALAGSVILELSYAKRLDTDSEYLKIINTARLGDALLDPWLKIMSTAAEPKSVDFWLKELNQKEREIWQEGIGRLVKKGILKLVEKRVLWVFGVRRYPPASGGERTEVRNRLRQLILSDALPEPRDAILLGLIHGCHLSNQLFQGPEYQARQARIESLASLDLIDRDIALAVKNALESFNRALVTSYPPL